MYVHASKHMVQLLGNQCGSCGLRQLHLVSHCDVDSHFKQNFEMTSSGTNAPRVKSVYTCQGK